ncbi:MAG: hypothetical protein LUB60_05970, partial [Clostridiales bacterium]|nr:hypothetical protein [Clostridiales bacterium]
TGFTPSEKAAIIFYYMKGGDTMKETQYMPTEKEMINNLIDYYSNLQRIKTSTDSQKEVEYQIRLVKAKLESFGIITSNLDINK